MTLFEDIVTMWGDGSIARKYANCDGILGWSGAGKKHCVLWGGSWDRSANVLRVAVRLINYPAGTYDKAFGIRCVSGFHAAQQ